MVVIVIIIRNGGGLTAAISHVATQFQTLPLISEDPKGGDRKKR